MAPFRAGGRSNRSGRAQADHDVFEGLPVRQWTQSETIVGLAPPTEVTQEGDNAWPELPMPRDSAQLAPWTQQLLREARRPRLAKRPQEPTEDDKQDDDDEGGAAAAAAAAAAATAAAGETAVQTGWQSKKWCQVPSHSEKPEREFLAKRRKGLPSLHTQIALQAANAAASSVPTRKVKVVKSDANGNTTVYEVLVPEGQTVEGEVTGDTVMPDAAPVQAAPGTVIEGVGIANAEGIIVATDLLQQQQQPLRRKPIPPRRIRKGGPGRGKKKVMFNAENGHYVPAISTPSGGDGVSSAVTPLAQNANADDSAMDIDSTPKPDAHDEGDDEEGDEGEDGEDGEDEDDREDGEVSDGEEPEASELQQQQQQPSAPKVQEVTAPEVSITTPEEPASAVEEADDKIVEGLPEEPVEEATELSTEEVIDEEPTEVIMEDATEDVVEEPTKEDADEAPVKVTKQTPEEITQEDTTEAPTEEAPETEAATAVEAEEASLKVGDVEATATEAVEASEDEKGASDKELGNDTTAGSEKSEINTEES